MSQLPSATPGADSLPNFTSLPVAPISPPAVPHESLANQILFASKNPEPSISEIPLLPELALLRRIDNILAHHKYVTFELPLDDGAYQTVHFVRPKDFPQAVAVHVTVNEEVATGVRFSSLSLRTFLGLPDEAVPPELSSESLAHELDAILFRVEEALERRSKRPMIVNLSPQGYHERMPQLTMSITDTGGQDSYIEQTSEAYASMGFQVVNVNRGGPNHPKHGFVRVGMHYHADGVDLLFLDDNDPNFVVKEDMYATSSLQLTEFADLTVVGGRKKEGRCPRLAEEVMRQLRREPEIVLLIGHYADGGETTRLVGEMMLDEDGERPPVWHIPHSTGYLKRETLTTAGMPVEDRFHIEDRALTEAVVYGAADIVWSTSPEISHSLCDHYHHTSAQELPIGVDTKIFHPRPEGVERDDPRYDGIWAELSRLSGRSVEDLQAAEMVLEYSRTVATKGKDSVIDGFAKSLELDPGRNRILVINIADPSAKGLSEVDSLHARELRERIVALGISDKVIIKHSFDTRKECPLLCQLTHVAVSGAKMETWGMAVQEMAASGCPVFCSTIVPIGTNVLEGPNPETLTLPGGSTVSWGVGAVRFKPGDVNAIGHLISYAFSEQGREPVRKLGLGAYNQVIPQYAWGTILQGALEQRGDFTFQDGKVVWPLKD